MIPVKCLPVNISNEAKLKLLECLLSLLPWLVRLFEYYAKKLFIVSSTTWFSLKIEMANRGSAPNVFQSAMKISAQTNHL